MIQSMAQHSSWHTGRAQQRKDAYRRGRGAGDGGSHGGRHGRSDGEGGRNTLLKRYDIVLSIMKRVRF